MNSVSKKLPSHRKLATGYCQCISHQRKRNRAEASGNTPPRHRKPSLAVLVLDNEIILCQVMVSGSTSELSVGDVLCFDKSIKLVMPTLSPDHVVVSLQNLLDISTTRYKISKFEDNDTTTSFSELEGENHLHHQHVQIQQVSQADVTSSSLDTTTVTSASPSSSPLLMFSTERPIPLLSLTLLVRNHKDDDRNRPMLQDDPLLQAHRKRQLIGKVILHSATQLSTTITIDGDMVTYEIKSVAGIPNRTSRGICYTILPSTRITFLPCHASETTSSGQELSKTTIDLKQSIISSNKPPISSPIADLISQTIRCMQQQLPVPQTFLLSGPPGVGKTYSIQLALQQTYDHAVVLESIRGSELLQEENPAKSLQQVFAQAMASSRTDKTTCLLFLDECDALVSVDSVAAMLAAMLDQIASLGGSNSNNIIVVGATNRIDSIPQYLRRAGRFDREIPMAPPDSQQRAKILSTLLPDSKELRQQDDKDRITKIAEVCVGYVPADLTALVRRAAVLAMQQRQEQDPENGAERQQLSSSSIVDCLPAAMKDVGASALRDAALAAPPKVTWADIAGDPGGAKTALQQAIEWPRTKAKAFQALGLQPPRGILLHGPPGCAKTTLARAAAGASGVAFLSLSPAEVYSSSYVGEAEAVVRRAFTLARSAAPCILFFDEMDSIFGNSENDTGRGSSAEARVLSTFLNEMDGIDIGGSSSNSSNGVLVLGATNRPWTLDSALLRPGRLGDKIIYVPPPEKEARRSILEKHFGSTKMDLEYLASDEMSGMFTGAELVSACQEAKMRLLREALSSLQEAGEEKTMVDQNDDDEPNYSMMKQEYLEAALAATKPLLSDAVALQEFRLFGMQH